MESSEFDESTSPRAQRERVASTHLQREHNSPSAVDRGRLSSPIPVGPSVSFSLRYLVTGCHEKLSSSYRWYQKRTVRPTFVRTDSLLKY